MGSFRSIVIVVVMAGAATGSQSRGSVRTRQARTEERVAGLLELPGILGDIQCGPLRPRNIDFYAKPSKAEAPAGSIEARADLLPDQPGCYQPTARVNRRGGTGEELPTQESGYEIPAAVVYERNENWFRIALQRGSAWIERENAEGFLAYPAGFVSDNYLTYLREGWDGKIWTEPGSGPGISAPQNWLAHRGKAITVHVISVRTAGPDSWIQVRFETGEVCGETPANVTPLEGWIPAYRPQGDTSVWFYSRGC